MTILGDYADAFGKSYYFRDGRMVDRDGFPMVGNKGDQWH